MQCRNAFSETSGQNAASPIDGPTMAARQSGDHLDCVVLPLIYTTQWWIANRDLQCLGLLFRKPVSRTILGQHAVVGVCRSASVTRSANRISLGVSS